MLLVTTILIVVTLLFPWTEVVHMYPPSASGWTPRANFKTIPYPFLYEGPMSRTTIFWKKTFIVVGVEALLGFGLWLCVNPNAREAINKWFDENADQ